MHRKENEMVQDRRLGIKAYVAWSYALFWAVILVLGGAAAALLGAPAAVMNAVSVVGSWTPTIALLILYKKLRPGRSVAEFYREAFKPKVGLTIPVLIAAIVAAASLVANFVASLAEGTAFLSAAAVPPSLLGIVALTVFQGPSGEESGWRGYLRPELEARFGFIKGNLILGLVWAFWHAPLWFLASGLSGGELLAYIVANIVVLSALTLIMATFMRLRNNLFIAVWTHFCFNMSLRFFSSGVIFLVALSAAYAAIALLVVLVAAPRRRNAPERLH